jgi:hypothetical protein
MSAPDHSFGVTLDFLVREVDPCHFALRLSAYPRSSWQALQSLRAFVAA